MKKIYVLAVSTALLFTNTFGTIPVFADSVTGTWYGNFFGLETTLILEDNNSYSIQYNLENPTYGTWEQDDKSIILDKGESNEMTLEIDGNTLELTSDDSDSCYAFSREKTDVNLKVSKTATATDFEGVWKVQTAGSGYTAFPAEYYGIENALISITKGTVQFYLKIDSAETPLKTEKISTKVDDGTICIPLSDVMVNEKKVSDVVKEVIKDKENVSSVFEKAAEYMQDNTEEEKGTEEENDIDNYVIKINKVDGQQVLDLSICKDLGEASTEKAKNTSLNETDDIEKTDLYHAYFAKMTAKSDTKIFSDDD